MQYLNANTRVERTVVDFLESTRLVQRPAPSMSMHAKPYGLERNQNIVLKFFYYKYCIIASRGRTP